MLPLNQSAIVERPANKPSSDFSNILTACLEISELLLHFIPEKDPIREDIEGKKRAVNLIKPFFSTKSHPNIEQKTLSINDVIMNSQSLLHRLIGSAIKLVIIPSPDSGEVRSNPEQIEQILFNLAINARDAMPSGGIFIIEATTAKLHEASAEIKNVAIPPGEYIKLFIRYIGKNEEEETRSNMNNLNYNGMRFQESHLGFTSTYRTVKQNRGDMHIRTEKGKGTTVIIYLPRADIPVTMSQKNPFMAFHIPSSPSYHSSHVI